MSSLDDLKKQLSGGNNISNLNISNFTSNSLSTNTFSPGKGNLADLKSKMQVNVTSDNKASLTAEIAKSIMEKRKNNKYDVVFILDNSGSCYYYTNSTIAGYNEFIDKQRSIKRNELITTVLFNDTKTVLEDRTPIDAVRNLNYSADGATRFYDTLCSTLDTLMYQQDSDSNKSTHTLVVVMTDAYDNRSKSSVYDAKEKIEEGKNRGYKFIFLGALESEYELENYVTLLGIPVENSSLYNQDYTSENFRAIEQVLDSLEMNDTIGTEWKKTVANALECKNPKVLGITSKG